MNVTREIVKDLLPLYVSGEASPDSRALVEAFLREDPELARIAEALRAGELVAARETSMPTGSERAALQTTKDLLRRRTWCLVLAWFFTGLPLSFSIDGSGVRFFLLRDAPMLACASFALAVAFWIAYGATMRRLRVTGL